jgi:hypothetical protein
MAEKVVISRIGHFDKDKQGNPLKSKTGKPYTRCIIDLVDGRKVSGFGNSKTQGWSAGAEVEIEITKSGEYLNFSVPKVEQGGMNEQDRERMRRMEGSLVNINEHVMRLYKHAGIDKTPEYPKYDKPVDFGEDTRDVPDIIEEEINF